jgi:methyltransferase of ATP-grasp peptide maturase system
MTAPGKNTPDSSAARRALAERLHSRGELRTQAFRAAVESVPRERFLGPGVFLPTGDSRWEPVTPDRIGPAAWTDLAYSDQSLVTQLDGSLTAADVDGPVSGFPTSSSTVPGTVVSMLEDLAVDDGMNVLEIGTGTGYSTALLCARLGEDKVTSIEVDSSVAARADAALEAVGYSTWTVTGDGLLGHPLRAPYDRVIATCAVRRIPYAWVRQTRPGGVILATVGAWPYGTGLARLTVGEDGAAAGSVIGRASFMPARAHALEPLSGDFAARAAYADTERPARLSPDVLDEWVPAFLAQLAAPGTRMVRAVKGDGGTVVYLFDTDRESFAALTADGSRWTVRQGGPVAVWDAVEQAITAWQDAGRPGIDTVRMRVTSRLHTYEIPGTSGLHWEHAIA